MDNRPRPGRDGSDAFRQDALAGDTAPVIRAHSPPRRVCAPAELSLLPEKIRRYWDEVFFREAWRDVCEAADEQALPLVSEHAFILFKPDAFVGRAVLPALRHLEAQDFTAVAWETVFLDRHVTRWLWLYRFNVASIERVWLHDLINSAGPSLLVVLRDERAGRDQVPATVRLTDYKGPSRPEHRRADQLRSILGVTDRLLNYMHTSDEPADLVRELGILLASDERRALITRMLRPRQSLVQLHEEIWRLEAATPDRPLTREAAVANIRRVAQNRAASADSDVERRHWSAIAAYAKQALDGDDEATVELWRLIRGTAATLDRWDVLALGTWTSQHDEPGMTDQTLSDVPISMWQARHARMRETALVGVEQAGGGA